MTLKDCLLQRPDVTTRPLIQTVDAEKLGLTKPPSKTTMPPRDTMEASIEVSIEALVGRKKKKQIKKYLKKQLGDQARGETFKSLLKKQFWKHFTQLEFGRPYNINPLKGVKATLIGCPRMSVKERLAMAVEAEIFRNELNRHTIYIDDIPTDVRAYMAGKDNDGTVN